MIDQLTSFLGTDVSYALGWTIIHSLWQVSLLALIMSGIHKVYQERSSEFKYNVALGSFLMSLVCSMVTFVAYYMDSGTSTTAETILNATFAQAEIYNYSGGILETINRVFTNNLNHINTIWVGGAILFSLKFIASFGYIFIIKSTAKESYNPEVQNILATTKAHLGIQRAVRFVESKMINVPMVLGYAKPIILFPIGMINILTTQEIEAIIAHELFHVKRNDYIVNMGLAIIEIVYFFHPAMWWISANIKAERENCCDDAAINYNIDSITYAKVLVKLEEMRHAGIPSLAMPFASNKHQLLNRIKRILNMEQTKNDIREKSVATVLLLFVAMLFASNANSQLPNNNDDSAITNEVTINTEFEIVADTPSIDEEKDVVGEIYIVKSSQPLSHNKDYLDSKKLDTLPQTIHIGNDFVTITTNKNGKKIEVSKENGKIKNLKIDGKKVPENEYPKHQDDIDAALEGFSFDNNGHFYEGEMDIKKLFNGKSVDSIFSNSFGMMFDGNDWKEMGGSMEQLLDSDVFGKLQDMENFKMFNFEDLDNLEELKGLENIKELDFLHNMEGFENLEETLGNMGIQLDSSMRLLNLEMDGFEGFDGFEYFSDDNMDIRDNIVSFGSGTVVDKLGIALNRDGLLKEYKSNEIELSGKHLKINGEKMPKALFNKYKNIYQEETGAPLTKKSKMVFDVEGKPSNRKVRSF